MLIIYYNFESNIMKIGYYDCDEKFLNAFRVLEVS